MDGGAWKAAVHGVAEGRTRLSDFTFTFHFHALEKEMATHSSVLAWRIPGTGEPGGLPSMGSHRVVAKATQQQQQVPNRAPVTILAPHFPCNIQHIKNHRLTVLSPLHCNFHEVRVIL